VNFVIVLFILVDMKNLENGWKKKYKDYHKLDTQLLCCGYPKNRREDPYKPNKKKKEKEAAGRGRWGNEQTDAHRNRQQSTQERWEENELLEGEYVKKLKAFAEQGRFDDFNDYVNKLKEKGLKERINSIVGRAMHGIRL